MADEGEVLVAILAGEGGSGHRAKVVGVVSLRVLCHYTSID